MQMKQAFTRGLSEAKSVISALSGNLIVSSFISILLDDEEDGLELELALPEAALEAVVGEDEAGAITRIAFNHWLVFVATETHVQFTSIVHNCTLNELYNFQLISKLTQIFLTIIDAKHAANKKMSTPAACAFCPVPNCALTIISCLLSF